MSLSFDEATATKECALCGRRVTGQKESNKTYFLIADGPFFRAWRIHHVCILRLWEYTKRNGKKKGK